MAENLVTFVCCQFLSHLCETGQIKVNNSLAFHANEMGMRKRLVTIVSVVPGAEFQFQQFPQFLEHNDGLVDRSQSGSGEIDFDLLKNVFNTRMSMALHQYPQYGKALGCNPMPFFLELS